MQETFFMEDKERFIEDIKDMTNFFGRFVEFYSTEKKRQRGYISNVTKHNSDTIFFFHIQIVAVLSGKIWSDGEDTDLICNIKDDVILYSDDGTITIKTKGEEWHIFPENKTTSTALLLKVAYKQPK
jgi:hypothetical protein